MQQAAPVGRDESVSSDVHSALQALGLEVLQLLQCLLEHNPGVVSTSQGCSFEGWKGSPALLASSQRSRQGASVGCLQLGCSFCISWSSSLGKVKLQHMDECV